MDETERGRLLSGRYRLVRVIGQGGMGVVWLGRDELLNRDVAVKEVVLPPYLTEPEQQLACRRAIREAQMAARLSHSNVVRVYDIVEADGHPCIVMEYLPYQSLRDLMADGPLPAARAARIGLGVLAALRAAHREGVLHRDVKPANIMVGPDGRVVLTDFGIARAADPSTSTLTIDGSVVGSPSYMAPERARGGSPEAVGPPGDLWGLGASLYAAVEGRPPFERDNALATLTAVVADELAEPAHAGPLGPVIIGLLRKDPHQRLGPDEAERMLRRVAAGDVVSSVVPPPRPAGDTSAAEAGEDPQELAGPGDPGPAGGLAEEAPQDGATESAEAESGEATEPAAAGRLGESGAAGEVAGPETARQAAEPDARAVLAATDAAPPGVAGSASRGHAGKRLVLLSLVILLAAGVAAAVLALTSGPRSSVASSSGSTPSAGAGSVTASPSAPAASGTPASAPAASGTPASAPSGAAAHASASGQAVPAGYNRFTNSTGFSIGVPHGWLISHVGHYVYIRDPGDGNIFLLIDQSDQPKSNPLADWEQQQASRESSYPDYHLIRLQAVTYPQAEKAADWEFTYLRDGVPVHILNRNVLANATHAYALYWSTPQSDWTSDYHYVTAFADTFRPAA
jgi:tRNA A-37 threonylcarbamoyl transferase component Bud32